MRRLLVGLISCYSHFLFLVRSSGSGDGLLCAPSVCANLMNVSFPFGAAPPCGASPTFLLSDCNSTEAQQAYWENFNGACPDGFGTLGAPAVLGIDYHDNQGGLQTFVNLTWDHHGSLNLCHPDPYSDISHYLPNSINLTAFANSAFQISDYNIYLLFNCSNSSGSLSDINSTVEAESPECYSYQAECGWARSCFQFKPDKEIMLRQVMERLVCSQFMFFVNLSDSPSSLRSRAGMVQLTCTESNLPSHTACAKCEETKGTCGYNVDEPDKFECFCPGRNQQSDTEYCPHVCNGLLCSTGSKIAIGVAVSVVAIFAVLALLYCCLRRRRKFSTTTNVPNVCKSFDLEGFPKRFGSQQKWFNEASSLNHLDFNNILAERPIEFSYSSLASATASFSTILGEGGFGVVYKGTAAGSIGMVAVKVLEAKSRHSNKEFLNELASIGNIHHVNVVRLLGFCVEKPNKMLVYEFVENGSLDKWLFKGGGESMGAQAQLDWGQRYAIAVGIARGLCYLHEECRHRIVHCDIKPHNILLDGQMCSKIADFGLARLMSRGESQVVTLAKGTPGYVAPEFWVGGECQLTTKLDVYSYGMVLLELMSGRRNFVDYCFPVVAFDAAMRGDFKSIPDGRIITTERGGELTAIEWHQVRTATFVALWCIQDDPARRPCMGEVVQYLEGVAAVSEQPPRPTIASTVYGKLATSPSQKSRRP